MKKITVCILAACMAVSCLLPTQARKKGYRLQTDKPTTSEIEEQKMSKGSFMIASQCPDCNKGYRLDQISFSGFDKPRASQKETFFITNGTDRHMTGVTLYVEYLTPDGRQLHKRFVRLVCNIPPGETRMAELQSWDRQRSFHYVKSESGKGKSSPFTVTFDPVAYYIRF